MHKHAPEWLVALLFSISFAVFLTFVSNNLNDRFDYRHETVHMQFAILEGKPYIIGGRELYLPAFQNRILFPAMLAFLSQFTILSAEDWFLILRFLSAQLLCLVFWYSLRKQFHVSQKLTAGGCLLLAYALVFTFNHPWEHPSDFPDAIFISLFITTIMGRHLFWTILLVIIAAFNRESAAFAGILWFCLHGIQTWQPRLRLDLRESCFAAMLSILAYAIVLGIRLLIGGAKAVDQDTQLITGFESLSMALRYAFTYPSLSSWLVLFFALIIPAILWVSHNRAHITSVHQRLLGATGIVTLLSMFFGIIAELRVFIPSIVILVTTAILIEATIQEQRTALSVDCLHNPACIGPSKHG